MRAISTVFDVTICLLLLSAAVVTLSLSGVEAGTADRTAEETASVLAATTADVEYRLHTERLADSLDSERLERRFADRAAWLDDRRRHGTLAGLLARAAIGAAEIDAAELAPETAGFRAAVAEAVAATLPARTAVTARWRPYPGAPINGTVVVGGQPPSGADVRTATLELPVVPGIDADSRSYRGLADAFAAGIVDATLPRTSGAFTLGDAGITAVAVHRYHALTGERVEDRLLGAEIGSLNRAATAELADTLRADLRDRFATPAAAAEAATPGAVWVTVRRWDA